MMLAPGTFDVVNTNTHLQYIILGPISIHVKVKVKRPYLTRVTRDSH